MTAVRWHSISCAEITGGVCSAYGDPSARVEVSVTLGDATPSLCQECARSVVSALQDKLLSLESSVLTQDEVTEQEVASFATYPLGLLLDELVMCTVLWHVGPLAADRRRIATALLERLASLGLAHKRHHPGCEGWPKYRLCSCRWEVPS